MICEIIRGIAFVTRAAEMAQKCADKEGFACDEAPCLRNRDEDDEEITDAEAEVVKEPEPEKKAAPKKKEKEEKNS